MCVCSGGNVQVSIEPEEFDPLELEIKVVVSLMCHQEQNSGPLEEQ